MSKTMQEAIQGQYPTLDFAEYAVVTKSSAGETYHPDQWPSSGFGSAPTIQQITTWQTS
tara:strand:+ start:2315 stop:2491 length:177 start_codon:yes stop_codon:yes gene_type:complete